MKRNEAKAALEVLLTMLNDENLALVDENVRSCWRDDSDWQFKEEIAEALDNQCRHRGKASKR
jgi:hypothetical protein